MVERPIPTPWERHPEEYWANDWGPPSNYIRCAVLREGMNARNAEQGWRVIYTEEDGWLAVICPRDECWELAVRGWERECQWRNEPVTELRQRPIRLENIILRPFGHAWAGTKRYWPERL